MGEPDLYPIVRSPETNSHRVRRREKPAILAQDKKTNRLSTEARHLSGISSAVQPRTTAIHAEKSSRRRRDRSSFLRRTRTFATKHTWTFPLVLLLVIIALYSTNPTESNIVHRFIFLSYKVPAGNDLPQYGKGPWDIAFVAFYTIVLAFSREFVSQELLRPLARHYGIQSRGKQARFMEQMYTVLYCSIMGPAGMYVMSRTPVWYFNTHGMYEAFPHKTHEACFKFYYLFQASYWLHQALVMVLGLEKRRKDFKELVGHHIVTVALIALSYRFHFTYMGIAVYVTHDISDLLLAASKSLNYIDSPIVGPFYALFVSVWIYLRHYHNLRIITSMFTEFRTIGPYELNWETQQYKCLLSNVITLVLLSALQALNIFWLYCVLRNGYKFVVYKSRKDDRSEESEGDETIPIQKVKDSPAIPIING